MALASGSQAVLAYIKESTRGTTPGTGTPSFLRATSRNVNLSKNTLESSEVRSTGQRADVRHGFRQIDGSIGFQLSLTDFDDLFEWAMRDTWGAVTISSTGNLTITTGSGDFTLTRTTGSWVTDTVRPGDFITLSGFSTGANNATWRVTAVTATDLTLYDGAGDAVNEGPTGATAAYPGKRIDLGNTLTTWSIERQFLDITQYQLFAGVACNSLGLSISPEAIVTGTASVLGMTGGDIVGTTGLPNTPSAASSNEPFAAFDGTLFEAGSPIALVTSMDFTANHNRSLEPVVGATGSPDVFDGTTAVTGTVTAFLEDTSGLYTKFANETESSIYLDLQSPDGTQWLNFVFPRVKYQSADIDPPQNGAVPQSMAFEALEDATYQTSFWVQRSNA
jgi:hypothetical protein